MDILTVSMTQLEKTWYKLSMVRTHIFSSFDKKALSYSVS